MSEPRHGRITDEGLAELRARLGQAVPRPQPHIEVATRDAIRHFAHGIGDDNPLWTDEAYARATRHGTLLAPPTILYAMDRIVSGYVGGLPGVHAMFGGTTWEWFRPIRVDDRVTGQARLMALIERPSRFARRAVQQVYRVTFTDQAGQRVAVADSWCFRTERDAAREAGKYGEAALAKYGEADLARIAADYEAEEVRGAAPRHWEDVAVAEPIRAVVKGPLTATSVIAFAQGWGGLYIRAHRIAFRMFRAHPALAIPNALGVPEPPERVHWDEAFAREVGVPGAYDYGPERVAWLGHLMTNWMGDDGFLERLEVQVRRHNLLGDTTWCRGRVAGKARVGNEARVTCEIRAENQRGEVTARGTAVVRLPARG
jgi:acyl dehydratase